MSLVELLSPRSPFHRKSRAPICSQRRFRQIVEHERQRSLRSGLSFCLVSFAPLEGKPQHGLPDELTAYLQSRLRDMDELGWLSEQTIGAILPYTRTEGGWVVVKDVCNYLANGFTVPSCEVSCFPCDDATMECRGNGSSARREGAELDLRTESMSRSLCRGPTLWKRTIDILVSALALIVLSPVFVAVSVAITLTSKGPVFFAQDRTGLGGRRFRIYKFRSMVPEADSCKSELDGHSEQDGPAFKMSRDPRVTSLGRLLRKTSVDELPQLWNVLRGDMTLVGPRPLPCDESNACQPWQKQRLGVTPGLTCTWQVHGRSKVAFDEWMRMDLRYGRQRSFCGDIWLMIKTIVIMIFPNGK